MKPSYLLQAHVIGGMPVTMILGTGVMMVAAKDTVIDTKIGMRSGAGTSDPATRVALTGPRSTNLGGMTEVIAAVHVTAAAVHEVVLVWTTVKTRCLALVPVLVRTVMIDRIANSHGRVSTVIAPTVVILAAMIESVLGSAHVIGSDPSVDETAAVDHRGVNVDLTLAVLH